MSGLWRASDGRLVVLIAAAHFIGHADRAAPAAFAPALKATFALTDAQIGALHGAPFVLSYLLATLWAGRRLRNPQPGRYMAVCALLWMGSAILFALAPSYGWLFLSRVGLGLGLASFSPMALMVLSSLPASGVGAKPISWFTAASSGGRSAGVFLAGALMALVAVTPWLAINEAWRGAGVLLALPNIIVIVLLWRASWPPAADRGEGAGLREVLGWMGRHPIAIGSHLLASCGVIMIVQSCGAWAPSILTRDFQFDAAQAAMVTGLVALSAGPLGHVIGGRLAEAHARRGRELGVLMALAALVAALGAFALALAPSPAMAIAALVVIVAAGGCGAGVSLIGMQPLAPLAMRRGMNSVFFATITVFGTALGPYLTGVISDAIGAAGERLALALGAALCVATLAVAVAVVLGANSRRALTLKIHGQA